jgi:Uma2 family endonuclease
MSLLAHAPPGKAEDAFDHRVMLHGVAWADLERVLHIRGDTAGPRITYLDGELELMSPSRFHEALKKMIARLLEAYAGVKGIPLVGVGSWTLKSARRKRAIEPDECYIVGPAEERETPDLAIEVIWTSGGIEKLEVYRGLGVGEVWMWRKGQLQVHVLVAGRYRRSARSVLFPALDLDRLLSFAVRPDQTQAVEEYRKSLRKR